MLQGEILKRGAARSPDNVALAYGSENWTYRALDDVTDRMAAGLSRAGVATGDRVALFLPNSVELACGYFACFKLGAVAMPLNNCYAHPEIRYAIEQSGATTLIAHAQLWNEIAPLPLAALGVERCYRAGGGEVSAAIRALEELTQADARGWASPRFSEDQPAAILYTSGTTAKPKGVTYSHRSLNDCNRIQSETPRLAADDVNLISMSFSHAAALTGQLLPTLFVGGACVLLRNPTPREVVEAIAARRATRLQMLPASLEDLIEYLAANQADLASARSCFAGGDAVPLHVHEKFRELAGFEVAEVCGMTECLTFSMNPPFGRKKLGSIGLPVLETSLRVIDEQGQEVPAGQTGELQVKSPAMMVGYWNNPAATAAAIEDGWLHTGDLGRRDEDGYYWFIGRKKELIIRGGSNISPLEVEDAIDEHPAVLRSGVVGVPDAHFGQIVVAYVVLRDAAPPLGADELRRFVAERLAAYKVPARFVFVPELPLNPTGKMDRHALLARAAQSSAIDEKDTSRG